MKTLYALPLILAACAQPVEIDDCDPAVLAATEDCQRQPDEARCSCDKPTASLPDLMRERGDRMPVAARPAPQPPTVEPPKPEPPAEPPVEPPKPEPEGPKHPGKEPNKEKDPDGWRDWRDAMDNWQAGH